MLACWICHFTSGTLEKTFIKAAGTFQGRTSVMYGQLLVEYSLQIFLWFHTSRFPEFLEKEELHCKTGACMHWSNTVGKYIKAWWHTSLVCVTALRTVPCSPATSLNGSTLQLCHGATDKTGSHTVIQNTECSLLSTLTVLELLLQYSCSMHAGEKSNACLAGTGLCTLGKQT